MSTLSHSRSITIADDSDTSVEMTLWGEMAEQEFLFRGNIVAIKSVRLSDFSNRSLNASMTTQFFVCVASDRDVQFSLIGGSLIDTSLYPIERMVGLARK